MGHMKNYRQLLKELPSNKVVFAFGCFQPPTSGHELQVKVVKKLAEEQNSDYVIYASQDLKEDLLPAEKKVQYMNLMFPNTNIKTTDVATFVEAAKELNKKYKNIVMVTSADCKEDYTKILNKKNGSEFFFETIEVVSAGDVNPDDNKLKESAKKGDYAKFKTSMPSSLREIDSRRLMNDMRQSLGLDMVKEEIKLVKDDLRESYFRGEIFNVGEIVESAGQQYEIVKRGSNHLLLKDSENKLVSKWIQDVTSMNESALNPKDPHGDYKAKSKTLQDIQMDPQTSKDPQMKAAVMQRKADLEREYAKHKTVKEAADSPVVNKNSNYNIAKDRLRYKDFVKLTKMSKGEVKENIEQEMDDFLATIVDPKHTGHTLNARDDNHRRRKIAYHLGEETLDELSSDLLGRYKKAAGEQASAADKAGDYEKGNKRFKGINKATMKQFDNDLKKEEVEISEAAPFKTKEDAVKYAKEKVQTHRDKLDGIEIHAHSGGFDVNHTSNSSGRNSLQKIGAKHLGTIYKEEVELEEGTFKYHMDKAIAAHERGDSKKKEYHLGNAKTARYTIPSADYAKHKDLFDKYKQMTEEVELEEAKKKQKKQADEVKPTAVEVKIGDDSQQLGANNSHGFDAFFNEEEEKEYSEEEIDKMIGDMSEDDIMDAYDDEELAVVDDETGEEIEDEDKVNESLMEVLSRIERMRARVRFAKTKSKRERQVKLALRRTSSNATINKRARRLAISLMKKRLLRGRPASALSVGEKERIERMIQKRKPVLNRIAMKLTSRVRQVEKARLNHSKFTQGTPAVGQI
jgi:phosphopantetheine adenylyltransferase